MLSKITKVLDKHDIMYNLKKSEKENDNSEVLNVYLDVVNREDVVRKIKAVIWVYNFADDNKYNMMTIYIPEVMKVTSESRTKVKNVIVEFNAENIIGSFGIKKRGQAISYIYSDIYPNNKTGESVALAKLTYLLGLTSAALSVFEEKVLERLRTDE